MKYVYVVLAVLILAGAVVTAHRCSHKKYINTVMFTETFDGKTRPWMPCNRITYDEAVKRGSYWMWQFGTRGEIVQVSNFMEGKPRVTVQYIYSGSTLVGEHVTEHWCQRSFTTMFQEGVAEGEKAP